MSERQRQKSRRKKRKRQPVATGFCSTPAQRAAQARFDRERDRHNRSLSGIFEFWRICAIARCRRTHRCSGAADCFESKWARVHPDDRFLLRETVLARGHGADPQQAVAIARQRLAERDALLAKYDALKGEPKPPPASAAEVAPPPQPRIRPL